MPSAFLVGPAVISASGVSSVQLVVTYEDTGSVDATSIDVNDVTVTGPGFATAQSPTAVSINGSGTSVTATYTIAAPLGGFTAAANGNYTVTLSGDQVFNTSSPAVAVPSGAIGGFRVAIPKKFTVDEATDVDDGNTSAGHLSLREAIRLANESTGTADEIVFSGTVFAAPLTIALTGGELKITDALTLTGPEVGLTINAGGLSRLFNINPAGTGGQVGFADLTLTGGSASQGGAIILFNDELTLSRVNLVANEATVGGAVFLAASNGRLNVVDSTLSGNTAGYFGGGAIYASINSNTVTLLRSTVSGNASDGPGGGIYFYVGGTLTVTDSTFSGNTAGDSGGAVAGWGTTMSIVNSTLSGNVAGSGGAISSVYYGTLAIENSTITGNHGIFGAGGINSDYDFTLSSSIVAGNISGGEGPDIASYWSIAVNGDHNVIGVGDQGGFSLSGTNKVGTAALPLDPRLAPLAFIGGATQVHGLLPGSPALEAGFENGLSNDQRGAGFATSLEPAPTPGPWKACSTSRSFSSSRRTTSRPPASPSIASPCTLPTILESI